MTLTENQKATNGALMHIGQLRKTLDESRAAGFNGQGVFLDPLRQSALLKVARAELEKAIGIIESTKWK